MNIEDVKKLRAIRRLARAYPASDADERLKQIAGIASGSIPHTTARRQSATAEQIRARLSGEAVSKPAPEKKRARRGGRDRKETGGENRTEADG